tara:strand:+ start:959 stop:3091 length:2133 start_codon:yes stop_codon:yes gene_type:complete
MFNTEPDLAKAVDPGSKTKIDSEEEHQLAKQQYLFFKRAYDNGHKEFLDLKEKCNNFYIGDQWDAETIQKLKGEGRPHLTINQILPTVNVVLGEQIGRRVDIQFKPRRDATNDAALALTKLTLAITQANQYHWLESQMFADGLIEERGYVDARMNFDKNIQGDIEITAVDGGDIIPDPSASSYDPKDWREFYRYRWLSLDEIEETYGEEHRKKLEAVISMEQGFGEDSIRRVRTTFGDPEEASADSTTNYYNDEESKNFTQKVRIIERQFYKPVKVFCLVDPTTGVLRHLPLDTKKEEAETLAAKFGASVYRKTTDKVRWRITADRFVIHDEWSPYQTFTIIPYFAYFRRGRPFGMVRNLLSPQEQLNKLTSQELHIVNTTANSGYVVEKGTLHGMTTDELRTSGSKSGVVIEVNPGKMGGLDKIKPNTIPTGIDRMSLKSADNIKSISGISDALLGSESAEVSGVALDSKERRGQVQIQVPIDNLSRTRHILARKVLELVQDFYTDERIIYITNEVEPGQPTEEVVINQEQEDGSIINDVSNGDYDIVISSLPARDNFRDSQFAEALNLRNVGVEIPDYRVIQYSNLAHKDEIAMEVKNLSGLGEQTEEQQQKAAEEEALIKRDMEAEVATKEAQAEERLSYAELNDAKIDNLVRDDDRELRRLEFEDAKDKRGSRTRKDLAELNAINKLDNTALSNDIKEGKRDEPQR